MMVSPDDVRAVVSTPYFSLIMDLLNKRSECQEALECGVHVASLCYVGQPEIQERQPK